MLFDSTEDDESSKSYGVDLYRNFKSGPCTRVLKDAVAILVI